MPCLVFLLTRHLFLSKASEWKRAYMYVSAAVFFCGSVHLWSCDSDYRSLKKRITAIRRVRGDAGSQVYVSSESDFDHFPRDTRASVHCSDGQEITDEGQEADDETNARDGTRYHQTDVNTPGRTDSIQLKELNRSMDDHGKVDTAFFFMHVYDNLP